MKTARLKWVVLIAALFLAGCKVELYSSLPESEANQMLALLMLKQIPADKQIGKGGAVTLRVEKDAFVNAVEILRQNGFPKAARKNMSDLFPSNQLVTSPTQERAKMMYLKEQQLESMLAAIDGVITANVAIAQSTDESGKQTGAPSAAVLIKYSPELNLGNKETQIKSLVRDSVPDIDAANISVVLQPATYRYVPVRASTGDDVMQQWRGRIAANPSLAIGGVISAALAMIAAIGAGIWLLRKR
ncbi:type III secretion system inner membrane ring lipoprotein SctJ [Paraburkholderia graminis]|uniref:Lipoprotein n=1 Tax=Paraburkholderia graminis TaxID=60548 RepID=A0ABD5C8H5_9BURK|nr:type III secretion inner membrane ring lipoprotein SctJ [Paraburkholderia graminis]MDR6201313.1 type III secretion protein J [Paraburkholderia graminis]